MHLETQLGTMTVLAGFLLKTSLGFCICWALTKAVAIPHRRFLVWFVYLFLAGCYWIWLLPELVPLSAFVVPFNMPIPLVSRPPMGRVQIQDFWVSPISIALRGLGYCYLAVLACFLFVRARKHLHLRWILRFTYRAPDEIENMFRPIAESLGAGQVQLLMLSGIYSPATFGWLRPTVLLPPVCLEEDEAELKDIFRHELQHVRRHDFVFNAIGAACRSLLFFHPAAWYAMGRLNLESELACDLAVVGNRPDRRASYAECLVRFARLRATGGPTPWNLDFAGSAVQLKLRIRSMLAGTRRISGWMLGLRAGFALLLIAAFIDVAPSLSVVMSYERPRAAQPDPSALANPPRTPSLRERRMKAASRPRAANAESMPAELPPELFPSAPLETAGDAAPMMTSPRHAAAISETDPKLKLRGRSDAGAAKTAQATTILLSTEPASESANSIARRASVASAITAGASEAARVASQGRDREVH
jgi:beta-lactamase regulating signal transducer with metallopeptidase domain